MRIFSSANLFSNKQALRGTVPLALMSASMSSSAIDGLARSDGQEEGGRLDSSSAADRLAAKIRRRYSSSALLFHSSVSRSPSSKSNPPEDLDPPLP